LTDEIAFANVAHIELASLAVRDDRIRKRVQEA